MPPPLKLVQLVQDAGVVLVKGIAGTPASSHRALGFGREGSRYGIDQYMVVKYICIGGV